MKDVNRFSIFIFVCVSVLWGVSTLRKPFATQSQVIWDGEKGLAQGESQRLSPSDVQTLAARGSAGTNPDEFDVQDFEKTGRPGKIHNKEVHRSLKSMQRLLRCFETQECNFDSSQPQSYHIAIAQELVKEIDQFGNILQEEGYTDPNLLEKGKGLALFFLKYPDDDVREAALGLTKLLPVSNENCDAVITALSESVSAPLYQAGLIELERYIGTGKQASVDAFLLRTLETGSPYTAKVVAQNALTFISDRNIKQFYTVMASLPQRSQTTEILKVGLKEFSRQQNGGSSNQQNGG